MKHKKIYKRLIAFLMAFIMFFTNPFQGFKVQKAEAIELILAEELGAQVISEVLLALYAYADSMLIASGNRDGFKTVDDGMNFLDTFNESWRQEYSLLDNAGKVLAAEQSLRFQFMDSAGQLLILTLLPEAWKIENKTLGTTQYFNPIEAGTNKFLRSCTGLITQYQNWKSSNAEQLNPEEKPKFTVINGTGGQKKFGPELLLPFIERIIRNDVPELDPEPYVLADGQEAFIPSWYAGEVIDKAVVIARDGTNAWYDVWESNASFTQLDTTAYIGIINHDYNSISFTGIDLTTATDVYWQGSFVLYEKNALTGEFVKTSTLSSNRNWIPFNISTAKIIKSNIPIFNSREEAIFWLQNINDTSNLVNGPLVNYSQLAAGAAVLFNGLNDNLYNPDLNLDINAALIAGAAGLGFSGTQSENTGAYAQMVTEVATNNGATEVPDQSTDLQPLDYGPILSRILSAIKSLGSIIWSFFENLLNDIKNIIQTISNDLKSLRQIFTDVIADPIIGAIQSFQDPVLDFLSKIAAGGDGMGSEIYEDTETGAHHRSTIITLANGLFLLLAILLALLRLFIHCMLFIFNIFRIPSSTAFLPDNVILGLEYLKQLEIPGIGISVYGLFMGLIYVLVFCSVIGVLRAYISRMRVPR